MLETGQIPAGSYTNNTNNFMLIFTVTGLRYWLFNGMTATIPAGGAVSFVSTNLADFAGLPG
jgi:hypothetical protein